MTWLTVERDRVTWTRGKPKRYASSPGVTREFCGDCGTDLAYSNNAHGATIDLTLGSLDCADGHPADRHIWTSHKLDWLHIDDHLPAYREWTEES